MLQWDEKYATGFDEIDAQHQVLFKYINSLEKIIGEGSSNYGRIETILVFFEDYAKSHFGYEEDCMHAHKCPFAQQNKSAHQSFIKIFEALHNRLDQEGPSGGLLKEIHQQATDWLVNHICKVDIHLKSCIK